MVEVRTKAEFSSCRLEGSINIPLNLIPENVEVLKKIPQEKNLSSNKQQEKIKDKTIAPIKKITPKVVALTVKTSKKQKAPRRPRPAKAVVP